jgi:hypothetical protein
MARCPAHDDRTPSLSVSEGDRAILVKCWAGCRVEEIASGAGVTIRQLFYDVPVDGTHQLLIRKKERQRKQQLQYVRGLTIDVRREADSLLAAAFNPGLKGWTNDALNNALDVVAAALEVRFNERIEHGYEPF